MQNTPILSIHSSGEDAAVAFPVGSIQGVHPQSFNVLALGGAETTLKIRKGRYLFPVCFHTAGNVKFLISFTTQYTWCFHQSMYVRALHKAQPYIVADDLVLPLCMITYSQISN